MKEEKKKDKKMNLFTFICKAEMYPMARPNKPDKTICDQNGIVLVYWLLMTDSISELSATGTRMSTDVLMLLYNVNVQMLLPTAGRTCQTWHLRSRAEYS